MKAISAIILIAAFSITANAAENTDLTIGQQAYCRIEGPTSDAVLYILVDSRYIEDIKVISNPEASLVDIFDQGDSRIVKLVFNSLSLCCPDGTGCLPLSPTNLDYSVSIETEEKPERWRMEKECIECLDSEAHICIGPPVFWMRIYFRPKKVGTTFLIVFTDEPEILAVKTIEITPPMFAPARISALPTTWGRIKSFK